MNIFRTISDIVFPKRYPSAWTRREMERENRWNNLRDSVLREEKRKFANNMRTMHVM